MFTLHSCSENKSKLQPNVEPKIFPQTFWKLRTSTN